jgi:drug/metabolite transporter (DMT)-like permease
MSFCLASGTAFGAMAIFGKLAYGGGATVGTLLSVRFVLAAVVLWALVLATGEARRLRTLRRRDITVALALGALGYALQAGSYFAALQRIDASLLSLVLYTFPAMVALAAFVLGRERLDARRLCALALALGGLVLVVAGAAGTGSFDALGAGLALAAATVYTGYILVGEGVSSRMSPPLLTALVCTGAALPLSVGAALLGDLDVGAVHASGWGWLACLVLVSTVASNSLFFAGLRRVGPTTSSILATIEPVVTVVLAFLVFGEALGGVQLLGGALVLGGAVVVALGGARVTVHRLVVRAAAA